MPEMNPGICQIIAKKYARKSARFPLCQFWFLSWPASGVVVVVAVSLQLFLLSPATATTSFLSTYLLNTLVQKEGGEQCDQIVQFIGLLATF